MGIFNKTGKRNKFIRGLGWLGVAIASCWLFMTFHQLQLAAQSPVGAYFVLGGSIRREITVAHLAKQNPNLPILISSGSPDPCILTIFQIMEAPLAQVWLEKCAQSTFGNFYYGLPLLEQWGVRKVKLLTSKTHLPRAIALARLILGSHGIWVELQLVPEQGVPGNRESILKTSLDLTRGVLWAIISQFYHPQCHQIIHLADVNLEQWQQQGFFCERQGSIENLLKEFTPQIQR